MNNKASITALMSSFGRAFHTENEEHPVFTDHLAKELMTAEESAVPVGRFPTISPLSPWILQRTA